MGSNLYEEINFKPCLTKQLLNVFKLWCECGIRPAVCIRNVVMYKTSDQVVRQTRIPNHYCSAAYSERCVH